MTRDSLAKFLPLVFVVAIIAALLNSLLAYQNLNLISERSKSVADNDRFILSLEKTLSTLKDAETGQRGYILTGNEAYLKPYNQALVNIGPQLEELKKLTLNNKVEEDKFSSLKKLVEERISLLKQVIRIRREQGFEAIQAQIDPSKTGSGQQKMDQIRSLVAEMEKLAGEELKSRIKQSEGSIDRAYTTVSTATFLNFCLIFLAYYLIRRELSKRNEFERRKDEFISMAGHELKTPITSMSVFAQVLERKLKNLNDPQASNALRKIQEQIGKQTILINDLLDISRIQIGRFGFESNKFDINDLIAEVVETVQPTTQNHQISIKGRLNSLLSGDKERIGQVLTNLLQNAINYSPKGGKIVIKIREKKKEVEICVKDPGIGISAKDQKNIFERFYRVYQKDTKAYPGLGIGLFISSQIINHHGGKIWVESKKGRGSSFYFSLPVARRG